MPCLRCYRPTEGLWRNANMIISGLLTSLQSGMFLVMIRCRFVWESGKTLVVRGEGGKPARRNGDYPEAERLFIRSVLWTTAWHRLAERRVASGQLASDRSSVARQRVKGRAAAAWRQAQARRRHRRRCVGADKSSNQRRGSPRLERDAYAKAAQPGVANKWAPGPARPPHHSLSLAWSPARWHWEGNQPKGCPAQTPFATIQSQLLKKTVKCECYSHTLTMIRSQAK